jgi:hypothetical protein
MIATLPVLRRETKVIALPQNTPIPTFSAANAFFMQHLDAIIEGVDACYEIKDYDKKTFYDALRVFANSASRLKDTFEDLRGELLTDEVQSAVFYSQIQNEDLVLAEDYLGF